MLVNFGIVATASGSQGGVTASHNRYGAYLRNRSIPVNPNTSRQQTARSRFQDAAERWSGTLSAAERAAWNLYGSNVTWLNALGETCSLTGFAHFVRSYCAMLAAGLTPVDDGPTIFSLPGADSTLSAAISEATQNISVGFDTNGAWVDEDGAGLLVHMSEPKIFSRDFIGGPYRVAGSVDGDSGTPPTSPQTIATPWAVAAGHKVEVKARIIRADGRVSQFFRTSTTVIS